MQGLEKWIFGRNVLYFWMPKGSVSNNRQVTSKAEDHATQDKIRDLAIKKTCIS